VKWPRSRNVETQNTGYIFKLSFWLHFHTGIIIKGRKASQRIGRLHDCRKSIFRGKYFTTGALERLKKILNIKKERKEGMKG